MTAPLLTTKLYVPTPRAKLVARPRLLEQLNRGLAAGHRLTLVSAPAGFGKTTLISAWIAECGRPAGWLALDDGDNDATRFLTYAIAALRTVSADLGATATAALHGSQPVPVDFVLTTLLNEIADTSREFILVLDDYHVIDAKPGAASADGVTSVDDALAFLLDHQPPQLHLVIATREDPALPVARLRARGQLTELRAADLRFTPAEAAEFLNRVMGLRLSDAAVAALETRTEGWIAGLQMAALSMQSREDVAGFIQTFTGSHRFILDYLLEEVLRRQPASAQAFLLRTAILSRLSGPLCDALLADGDSAAQDTGETTSQATLEHLERANLFIVPLDDERRWYRYHHLFGDLLRQQLERSRPASEIAEYHRRAGAWHERDGNWAEAFHHALAAGDPERAARLAETAWEGLERAFQTRAWVGWVAKLPPAVVRGRPRLCVQLGWAYSDIGELDASEANLRYAESAPAAGVDAKELPSLRANVALIRASNAQNRGDLAETVRYTELAMRLAPDDDALLRAQAAITLGFTHWATGNVEASLGALITWQQNMQQAGNRLYAIASAFALADMLTTLGRLDEAEATLRQSIQWAATEQQDATAVTAHHHLGLALIAHERGDAAAMAQHLTTAADLGRRTTLVDWPYRWNLALARLKESAGEFDAALALLDEAARVYVQNPVPRLQPIAAQRARVYLKQGRLDRAQAWARERGISTEDAIRYLDEYDQLTLARVRLAEGALTGVNDLLARLLAAAEAQRRSGSALEILLMQALAHEAQGDRPRALAALEHALALAEPEGYVRSFADEGEPLRLLLLGVRAAIEKHAFVRACPSMDYVNRLLAAFPRPANAIAPPQAIQAPGLIEPLSERELEVLRLIAAGLSNGEISRRLVVALSTVKGHNLRIFGKLQAQNRTEAVARARALGLL